MIKAALLVAQDVQYEEFIYPYEKMKEAGLDVTVILAPKKKYPKPTAKNGTPLFWDKTAQEVVQSGDMKYDLVFIPGGWCPEVLRVDPELMAIVRYNIDKGSLIAAICHGPQVLLSARTLPKGMYLTGYVGIKHDIENAGYVYPLQDIMADNNILTCSHYKFNASFIQFVFNDLAIRHVGFVAPQPTEPYDGATATWSLQRQSYEYNHNERA